MKFFIQKKPKPLQGKPYISGVEHADVSISHDGDYAIASVVLWE